jgi:hypothetical protein
MTQATPHPDDRPDPSTPPSPTGPAPSATGPPQSPPRLWMKMLAASLVAGLASWLIGETSLVRVPVREDKMRVMGHTFEASNPRSRQAAADADAARFYGLLGASMGLALGVAGGLSRRSTRAASAAAVVGVAAGILCHLVASRGAVPLYHRLQYSIANDLIASLAMHATVFAAAGAAGGLALGVGLGGRSRLLRSTLGGAVGALFGAIAFEFLGALLFASSDTGQPLAATAPARLLGPLLVSAFVSLGASWSAMNRRALHAIR